MIDFDTWCEKCGWQKMEDYIDSDECPIDDPAVIDPSQWLSNEYESFLSSNDDYLYEQYKEEGNS